MGNDLAAACIFCASLLLTSDVPTFFGFSGELTGAYGTLQRRITVDDNPEAQKSDVTGKFPLVGFGWSRPAPKGLGAGTPASEVRVRIGWATSHDEATEVEGTPGRLIATGTGRFENLAVAVRGAISGGSAEGFLVQHRHKVTDLVMAGTPFDYEGPRYLIAERRDGAVGWRQRFENAEIAGRFQYTVLQGKLNTAGGALLSRGGIPGGGVEAAVITGNWRLSAGGEWLSGHVARQDQYYPDFVVQSGDDPASLAGASLRAASSFGRFRTDVGLVWERANLPWVSYAVLGEEQRRFESGYRLVSEARSWGANLEVRYRLAAGVSMKLLARATSTTEAVTFTDALGSRPSATPDVVSTHDWQYAFGIGLDFSLGGTPVPNPVP